MSCLVSVARINVSESKGVSMNQGYYSQPTISKTEIAFISDDDLWIVDKSGGEARRLTANRGVIASPCFSPDGKKIAFISYDMSYEGDLYVISHKGGEAERLTWLGVNRVVSWKDNENIYFTSGVDNYPGRETQVYEINVRTRNFSSLNLGPCTAFAENKYGQVLARNSGDSARWKRYQGGTAGVIWVKKPKGKFERILANIKTNITRPEVIEDRIYFVTDHEGIANVYSCDFSGKGLKRYTEHIDYYCRNLRSGDNTLVYQNGGEIYSYDLMTHTETKIEISCLSTSMQVGPRYKNWSRYYNYMALHPQSEEVALVSRGHLFRFGPYSGPIKEMDLSFNSRYVCPEYNFDGSLLLTAGNQGESDEKLFLYDLKIQKHKEVFKELKLGKIWEIRWSPKANIAVLVTNRQDVYLLDFKTNKAKKIDHSEYSRPSNFDWSPDGRFVAYSMGFDSRRSGIKIYDVQTDKSQFLLTPVNSDSSPSFSPDGQYLHFLGVREFAPNYNETHFDLGFPFAVRPYVVALNRNAVNPFEAPYTNPRHSPDEAKTTNKKTKKEEIKTDIEWEGIENRVLAFNVDLGGYHGLVAIPGGVLYLKFDVEPMLMTDHFREPKGAVLYSFKFEDGAQEVFQKDVVACRLNHNKQSVLMFTDSKLRICSTTAKPSSENKIGKKDGYVETSRIRLKVDPRQEWAQMYHEAWSLQKEHFWRADMSKINWDMIYQRYRKLLPKIRTRAEFSDLMWEMQGELGTSHCYEMRGDYERLGSFISHGRVGGYFSYDEKNKCYRIQKILKGDSWIGVASSPLAGLGAQLEEGDLILAVEGRKFTKASDLYEALENKSLVKVELLVKRKNKKQEEIINIKTSNSLRGAWYRDWVEKNKKYVHEKSKGRIGYLHIPDMGAEGYAEFYRHFVVESQYEGLVVDLRYNGGGHVSQHLLKVLAQKVLGFDQTRYQGLEKYPMYAPGALAALANEYSGSDGDIFPHSFKLMKLGPLIGKRTWGGIIGINGQYRLRDGTYVTQPEYSFWFKDNEWYVENHGVAPNIEVDITPEDYRDGRDPQLDRAVVEIQKELKARPGTQFKPSYYPDLSVPHKLTKLNR